MSPTQMVQNANSFEREWPCWSHYVFDQFRSILNYFRHQNQHLTYLLLTLDILHRVHIIISHSFVFLASNFAARFARNSSIYCLYSFSNSILLKSLKKILDPRLTAHGQIMSVLDINMIKWRLDVLLLILSILLAEDKFCIKLAMTQTKQSQECFP